MPSTRSTLEKRAEFLRLLANGHTVKHAAAAVGLARGTFYKLRDRDEGFKAEWNEAQEAGTQTLEQEARRRAVEGVKRPVYQHGALVGHVREYSDTLLIFLLKARRPEVYRERMDVTSQQPAVLRIKLE